MSGVCGVVSDIGLGTGCVLVVCAWFRVLVCVGCELRLVWRDVERTGGTGMGLGCVSRVLFSGAVVCVFWRDVVRTGGTGPELGCVLCLLRRVCLGLGAPLLSRPRMNDSAAVVLTASLVDWLKVMAVDGFSPAPFVQS